jgi:hypothetical protein
MRTVTVFRGDESGVGDHEVRGPVYRDKAVWERIAQIWSSPEFRELADYLWERGAMKKTFFGPDPSKDTWARFVFGDLVHSSLLIALEWTAREALLDAQAPVAWAVDESRLERIVQEACAFYCERKGVATGYCPLGNISLPSGIVHELASDITLKQFTARERDLFLTRWQGEYLWDDFKSPLLAPLMTEVRVPFTVGTEITTESLLSSVRDRLDVLKWALFLSMPTDRPPVEGTCLVIGRPEARMGRFRRDEHLAGVGQLIDDSAIETSQELIRRFRQAAESASELKDALWYFGRASVAELDRDILLESSIGLETLLVSGGGDSRYRFALHGAVVLSNTDQQGSDLFRNLRDIYGARSGAAHGERKSLATIATRSRRYLAEAIRAIAGLVLAGAIQRGRVSEAVQQYVVERATKVSGKDDQENSRITAPGIRE